MQRRICKTLVSIDSLITHYYFNQVVFPLVCMFSLPAHLYIFSFLFLFVSWVISPTSLVLNSIKLPKSHNSTLYFITFLPLLYIKEVYYGKTHLIEITMLFIKLVALNSSSLFDLLTSAELGILYELFELTCYLNFLDSVVKLLTQKYFFLVFKTGKYFFHMCAQL